MANNPLFAQGTSGKSVDAAYDLRMHGNADQALEMLEAIVAENPENAFAWYELARTRQHVGLANPRQLMEKLGPIQEASNKTVELEPDNYTFAVYNAGIGMFAAYPSLMRNAPDVQEKLDQVVEGYETVLEIRPECPVVLLTLTEISAFLHRRYDGDLDKAEAYAAKLEGIDPAYGAKAREILLPDDADRVAYWKDVLKKHPENQAIRAACCKACLLGDKMEEATSMLEGIEDKSDLWLAFARFHGMQGMRNEKKRTESFETAVGYFDAYLKSDPVDPMKAWVIGAKAMMAMRSGNDEEGQKLREAAKQLDPFYSKATGVPAKILFTKPGEFVAIHNYWFRFI